MKPITIYESFDGERFDSESACKSHERENAAKRLVGLAEAQIAAALDGTDPELADAIETLGKRIERARLDRGERKRKPSGNGAAGEAAGETAREPEGRPAYVVGSSEPVAHFRDAPPADGQGSFHEERVS
jgi:hypothetical protein